MESTAVQCEPDSTNCAAALTLIFAVCGPGGLPGRAGAEPAGGAADADGRGEAGGGRAGGLLPGPIPHPPGEDQLHQRGGGLAAGRARAPASRAQGQQVLGAAQVRPLQPTP